MVQTWILNSIDKEMSDSSLSVDTAKGLWDTLKRRYGGTNVVFLFQLEKEISNITQGNQTVTQYFNEIQRLLDELVSLQPPPKCSCDANKILEEYNNSRNVVRFLVGLNEGYNGVKDTILLMNPLLEMDKAFWSYRLKNKDKLITLTMKALTVVLC